MVVRQHVSPTQGICNFLSLPHSEFCLVAIVACRDPPAKAQRNDAAATASSATRGLVPEARAPASEDVVTEPVVATAEEAAEAPVPAAGGTLTAGEAAGGASVEGASPEPTTKLEVTAPPGGRFRRMCRRWSWEAML